MKAHSIFSISLAVAGSLALSFRPNLEATEVSIELPPETGTYRPAPGVELAQAFCIQCHSVDYAAIQPPMPKKFWAAEIVKMREKYFAPVPKDMDEKLTEYLAKAYGADATAKP